jgi:Flp pilus assembly pilin Flp
MRQTLRSSRSRSGQALVEYALAIALVAVGLSFTLLHLRNSIGNSYSTISNGVAQAGVCEYGAACASGTGTQSPGNGNGNNGGGNGNNGGGNGNGNGNSGGNGNGNNGNGNGNGGGKKN